MRRLLILLSALSYLVSAPLFANNQPEIVKIKGGSFAMGSAQGEGDEEPVRTVTVSDFYIGKYEVTVRQYKSFVSATDAEMPKEPKWGWQDNHPIMNLSWHDAQAYIDWLNETYDESFRLPTEAEFEYVMREGVSGAKYSWKNEQLINENIADESFREHTSRSVWDNYDDGFAFTAPVGSYRANGLGVHDINGNVWEWVSDWYAEYPNESQVDPSGPKEGSHKVGRGASFGADPWHTRIAGRNWVKPEFKGPGFRLAKDVTD